MNYHRNVILKYLDSPSRFAFWTIDEISILLVPFFSGFLLDAPLRGIICAIGGYMLLKQIKTNIGGAKLRHAMYWYLPWVHTGMKVRIPSHIREYIG